MSKYRASMISEQMDVVHDRASIIVEEEDRISNLPNEIIHLILSFLDMKYAIETRKLSKKWKHIWTSMPYLNLNSKTIGNLPLLSKFVKHVLSGRNLLPAVSEVELSFEGAASQLVGVVKSIVKYVYSHNIRRMTMIWSGYNRRVIQLQWLFRSHTLKHLTLATTSGPFYYCGRSIAISTWDFPVLETLNLSNIPFGDDRDKSLNLFSKCVNLKDLSLHHCDMFGLDIFSVCAPRLCNLTITDPHSFPKVFRVVAPQLENLTITNPYCFPKVFNMFAPQLENLMASVSSTNRKTLYNSEGFFFLHLSTDGLDSLEKVDLSLPRPLCEKERYGPRLLDLFKKLRTAKFLILDMGIIEALSSSLDQILHEPCPFNNLKCLRIKMVPLDHITTMHTQVINYLLQSSPTATFIMDIPQVPLKRSREEVGKGTVAKKMARLEEEKQQPETMAEETRSRHEVDKGTMAKQALSSCLDQLTHEPSPFNNLKCFMPTQVGNYLHESSPSTTFLMDLSQKRTRQEVDKGTMAKKLEEEEQPQKKTMAEEKRSRQEVDRGTMIKKALPDQLSHEPSTLNQLLHESSPFSNGMCLKQKDCSPRMPTQIGNYLLESSPSATFTMDLPQVSPNRSKQEVDKGTNTMAKKLAMLEEEKQQTETMAEEKRILEEKIQMQDETIAQQKAMMEAMKLQHEKRRLEAKIEMQDTVIAQQKSMLEAMKLQHENGTLEAKIQMQDLVIAEQKSMLEAMKLQHEKKMFVAKLQTQDEVIAKQKYMLEVMRLQR